jgi:hypothetical protein
MKAIAYWALNEEISLSKHGIKEFKKRTLEGYSGASSVFQDFKLRANQKIQL